ncbi:hypothetical protein AAFF_G00394950 [Aldrovandia affinis]|uniref:TNFR-Cys domain-containing protein n=1 Tax=Aldrovandia affinis TaxID=143900 RepID=A0AAD7SDQ9_9TELE|nr:hypothetical protein AAFF_G00394950 [Aldrovandia affinis]
MSLTGCPITPTCGQGFGQEDCACVPCLRDQYWQVKSRLSYCIRCTEPCSAHRNLKQVIDCGPTQNRVCHCDRGFLCKIKAQFKCRRCEPCPPGTFSNKLSMENFCRPHTDCSGLGLAVISKGNSTHDQLPVLKAISLAAGPGDSSAASWHVWSVLHVAQKLPAEEKRLAIFETWKSSLQEEGRKEENFHFLSRGLLDSKTGDTQQVAPPKQQVTVDHSGGGDSVSNTVGSIYIYSPRMVVLGANSSEQREEAEPPGEEGAHLGSPQQESHVGMGGPTHQEQGPMGLPVRVCVQEEESKELSYPVPATGK